MSESSQKPGQTPGQQVAEPPRVPTISPYLAVGSVESAMTFYEAAFGCTIESVERGSDGKPYHAVLAFSDARIQLGPETADMKSPRTLNGASTHLQLQVANVDVLFDRALDAGARPIRSPRNEFWGARCCLLADPDGHVYMLATPLLNFDAWRESKKQLAESLKDPSEK